MEGSSGEDGGDRGPTVSKQHVDIHVAEQTRKPTQEDEGQLSHQPLGCLVWAELAPLVN